MDLEMSQMKTKPRKIGDLGKEEAFYSVTKGGLSVIHTSEGAKIGKILGIGGHIALAKMVAKQRNPGLEIGELTKSEAAIVNQSASTLLEWISVSDRAQALLDAR